MLITQLKPDEEIRSLAGKKTVILSCEGCKEIYFPGIEAEELYNGLLDDGIALAVITADYICNPDNLELYLQKHMDRIDSADTLLVFSCGVGAQTAAERFAGMPVYAGCDTYPVPGAQGVTPLEYDCARCGECHLNETGGICPITACAKSLVNGQCGGAKNGACEVDKDMECGWERIFKRLDKPASNVTLRHPVKIRNYSQNI